MSLQLLLAATAVACASSLAVVEVNLAQRGFALLSAPQSTHGVIALVDTRVALSCARGSGGAACTARVPLRGREQLLHVYSVDPVSGTVALTQQLELPRAAAAAPYDDATQQPPSPLPPVGILYELWHSFTATAYANVSARGGTPLAVEDVLQAPNGSLAMSDVLDRWGVRDAADRFFYQEQPSSGYYCMYRRRAGEAGLVPDCAGISATAARHAAQLSSAGVTFVAVDATNLGTPSTEAEVIQVRPSEVLMEEWAVLRAAGVPTPAIAAWQRAEAGATLWQSWLSLYNNASYDALIARGGPANAKKLFFVPSGADAGVVAAIEANGGRHDVLVVPMWANDHKGAVGEWAFMAPCTNGTTNATAGPGATYTTSVVGLGRGASACYQQLAVGSPVGSALSFSPSYQLSYGSVPFSSANKYEGLTFKRQWATLFEGAGAALEAGRGDGAWAGALPDNLFVSSFNEWISQPQPNPYPAPWAVSMGLWGDNESQALFVDSYGTSCSRDIEPSARPGGDVVYSVLTSCLRVAALLYSAAATEPGAGGAFAGASPRALRATFGRGAGSAGLSACAVAGEACCTYNETIDGYVPVWSFRAANGSDYLVSASPREVAQLRAIPAYFPEQCTGFPGQTDFCYSPAALANAATAWRGPFILHSGGCGLVSVGVPRGVPVTPGLRLPDRLPLYRCLSAPGSGNRRHYLTADATCAGVGVAEALGCTHATRSSNMARPLRSCRAASGLRYHVTDGVCDDADADEGILGYVR